MANQINLLAWRDQEQARHKFRFLLLLFVSTIFSILIQLFFAQYLTQQNSIQINRNHSLASHINKLANQLTRLDRLKTEHKAIIAKLDVLDELQINRNKITQLLALLSWSLEQGIYLQKLRMNDRNVEIKGFSSSNQHLTMMLNKIENSAYADSVEMHSIVSKQFLAGYMLDGFNLSFQLLPISKDK